MKTKNLISPILHFSLYSVLAYFISITINITTFSFIMFFVIPFALIVLYTIYLSQFTEYGDGLTIKKIIHDAFVLISLISAIVILFYHMILVITRNN